MLNVKQTSQGKTPDFDIHPLTKSISDTLGRRDAYIETDYSKSMIMACLAPSIFDYQHTIDTMDFTVNTGKVRTIVGPKNELDGLRKQHILHVQTQTKNQTIPVTRSKLIAPS